VRDSRIQNAERKRQRGRDEDGATSRRKDKGEGVHEDHKLSGRNNRKRHPAYICVAASRRIPRTRHPKYLHCPVAKLESNRFEMTFHLTKHKSRETRTKCSRPPAGLCESRQDNVLSFLSLFLFHSPALFVAAPGTIRERFPWTIRRRREISLCGPPFVSSRQPPGFGNCYCALISRMS